MAIEDGTFVHGGTTYPVDPAISNDLLRDADPALYYTIDFFKSVLTTYLNDRFIAELARVPAMPGDKIPGIIAGVSPFDPAPYLAQGQFQFPLLAVFRQSAKYTWRAQGWMRDDGTWFVQYILPPLTPGQMERLYPILHSVEVTLLSRIENMGDPGYQDGADVWALAGIESIDLVESVRGNYTQESGSNLIFPTWKATLLVKERDMPPPEGAFSPFAGIDTSLDLTSPQAPQVTGFVQTIQDFVDPGAIPNVAASFLADQGITTAADGFSVASWLDETEAVAAVGIANHQPVRNACTFVVQNQPKASVRFDGVASYLQSGAIAALATDAGFTICVFARLDSTSARQSLALRSANGDTGAHTLGPEANTAGTAGSRFGVYAGGSSYDTPAATDQQWHTHLVRVTATTNGAAIAPTLTYRIDGSPQTLSRVGGSGNWQGMSTANLIDIGANPAALASTALSGDVAIVVPIARALTDAECADLERACRDWAGLPNP